MNIILQQNVPACPHCSALMVCRIQREDEAYLNDIFFLCTDCKAIFKVVGRGKAENELIVTDERND